MLFQLEGNKLAIMNSKLISGSVSFVFLRIYSTILSKSDNKTGATLVGFVLDILLSLLLEIYY
jgi:hypothetical protein